MKRSLLQAFGIVIISGVLGMAVNAFRVDGIPLVERWQEKIRNEELAAGLPAVSMAQAMEAFANGDALFVDARDPDFFKLERIPGAVNLPVYDFDRFFPSLKEKLFAAPQVIAYCGGASCETSVELTEKLLMAGLDRVAVFTGGIQQWQASGQPVEEGPAVSQQQAAGSRR